MMETNNVKSHCGPEAESCRSCRLASALDRNIVIVQQTKKLDSSPLSLCDLSSTDKDEAPRQRVISVKVL